MLDIEAIRARVVLAECQKGSGVYDDSLCEDCGSLVHVDTEEDFGPDEATICHGCEKARLRASAADVPALLAEVDRLRTALAEVTAERDAARRDLGCAQRFEVRHVGVDFDLDDGNWHVWDRVGGEELAVLGEQSAALARARELTGEKEGT
jgi:hypothetical protein